MKMSRKRLILPVLIALVLGIAIGFGIEALIVNASGNSNTESLSGTVLEEYESGILLDEDGNEIEIEDVYEDGIVYNICVFQRRNEEISYTRDWYGPYSTVKLGLADVEKWLSRYSGFYEAYVYKNSKSTGLLTLVCRTYFDYSD